MDFSFREILTMMKDLYVILLCVLTIIILVVATIYVAISGMSSLVTLLIK